jgi:4-diphosphocytidyl-2-C-methyl-D-erythritol kinase
MDSKMNTIKIPAKVNLSLEITGVEGGLHTLKMETMAVDLCDVVCFEKTETNRIEYAFGATFDGFDEMRFRPVIDKAINAFVLAYGSVGARIVIDKNIPLGAGLGGSSSAVVGVVKALEMLKNTQVDTRFLLSIGSDLPVVYRGGRNLVTGVGDIVEALPFEEKHFVILVDGAVDSKECYCLFDKIGAERYGKRQNHLEKSARIINKGVAKSREILESLGAKDVVMSGSGSAVVGVFDTEDEARKVFEKVSGVSKYLAKSIEN